ncbi:MAG: flagellar biosynthetic protein FliQ [Candidatus Phlomobacter fragariae]
MQALAQLQEQTLGFLFKLISVLVTLLVIPIGWGMKSIVLLI